MLTKTRSDLLITTARHRLDKMSHNDKNELIRKMFYKIEKAHDIANVLENDKYMNKIGASLRKALEL